MANTIKIKRGPSSSLSTITLQDGEMAFTTDTKKLYISNTDEPINNNTTYSISKSGSTITLTGSDGSKTTVSDSNTTYGEATTSANGLMTSTMVSKLNGIATGANKTTVDSALSSTSTNPVQNKVINTALASKADTSAIPTKTSQLTNDSGFKTTDNNTTYSISKSGSTITLTGSDGSTTSVTDADTNTTYSAATTSANGLMTAAMVTKLNGIAAGANAYTLPTASSSTLGGVKTTSTVTSTSGLTACPIISGVPYYKDTNTTYSAATTSAAGLMSAADKTKLDGITASADTVAFTASLTSGTQIGTITINGTATKLYCQTDTNTTYSVATQSANGLMSAADKKTLDGMTATTTTPKAAGTAAVGSETKYARGDHVHPAQTTVSGNAGSAIKWATARTLTIGKTGKSVNGTANVSWSLDEIGSNVYVGTSAPSDADVDVWVDPTGSINLSALWNSIYPVGSIYMSTSSTNPKDLFTGTTWTQITDRFLVGMGSTYTTAGGTGGASSVTLATGNLPSHRHSVSITSGNQSANHTHSIPALSGTAASAGSHNHLVTSKTTSYGSGSQSGWRCLSWTGTNADWTQNVYSGDNGAHTHDVTTTASTSGSNSVNHTHSVSGNTGYLGSGTAFSIIPPYYAVYMWRRTA